MPPNALYFGNKITNTNDLVKVLPNVTFAFDFI